MGVGFQALGFANVQAKKSTLKGAFFVCGFRLAFQRSRQVRLDSRQDSFEAFGVTSNDVTFF